MRLAAVLLAAGEARRMGGIDKLMLRIDGVPLVRRAFDMLRAAGVAQVVVVCGHRPERVRALFAAGEATLITNERYQQGQQGSVLAGMAAIEPGADAVMVALGDMPLVQAADLVALACAFEVRAGGRDIIVPMYRGARGNPVLFGADAVREILAQSDGQGGEGADAPGARGFIAQHRERVQTFECDNDHLCVDMDTPEDIERVQARLGRTIEGWRAGSAPAQGGLAGEGAGSDGQR